MYVIRNGQVWPQQDAENYQDTLPIGVYTPELSMFGWFLARSPEIQIHNEKIYGDVESRANRVIQTYEDRATHNKNTGVLLTGIKGSGKTMLTKVISKKMLDRGISTIIVGSIDGDNIDGFLKFMNLFDGKVVILFDEFEKNFDNADQMKMLSMFDGISMGTKLFLLTSNDVYKLNTFMLNRPGRLYYRFDYMGLDKEFVLAYLTDVLNDKSLVESTADSIERGFRDTFTFDMLQTVVEEMNRYSSTFVDVVSVLNIDVQDVSYDVTLIKAGNTITTKKVADLDDFYMLDTKKKEHTYFDKSHFTCYDAEKDCMVFENAEGYTAEARTVRTSKRSRSFFFDAI
jgi:hypothetical protein